MHQQSSFALEYDCSQNPHCLKLDGLVCGLLESLFGWRKVECVRCLLTIIEKRSLGQSWAMCPDRRQLSHNPFLRASWRLSSKDFALNNSQCISQWLASHKGHVTVDLVGEEGLLLEWSICSAGERPCVTNANPWSVLDVKFLGFFLESFFTILLFTSVLTLPNTGWLAALAFSSMNTAINLQ